VAKFSVVDKSSRGALVRIKVKERRLLGFRSRHYYSRNGFVWVTCDKRGWRKIAPNELRSFLTYEFALYIVGQTREPLEPNSEVEAADTLLLRLKSNPTASLRESVYGSA